MPWLGYFDKIDAADVFVFLDDTQFKKNEWQNRNRIRGPNGSQWLTVPVRHRFGQPIVEVKIDDTSTWSRKHLEALKTSYGRAPYFDLYIAELQEILHLKWDSLAELNITLVRHIAETLGITCQYLRSSKLSARGRSTELLVKICRELNADTYLSGAGGHAYLDTAQFQEAGIRLTFQEYTPVTYKQCFPDYVSHLSVVDLLFNHGPNSLTLLRAGRQTVETSLRRDSV